MAPTNNTENLKSSLKSYIKENKINLFYQTIEESILVNSEIYEEYILLKSRENKVEDQFISQLVSLEEYSINLEKIRKALLHLANSIKQFHLKSKHLSGLYKAITVQFEKSQWNFYSFDQRHNTITIATLTIQEIDFDRTRITLENPEKGFPYEGILNFIHTQHDIIQIELINKRSGKSHIQSKFHINLNYIGINFILGQLIYSSFSKTIKSSNVVLERVLNNKPKKRGFYLNNDEKISSIIRKFINPNYCTLRIIPFENFKTLDEFEKWLTNKNNQLKYNYRLLEI